MNSLPDCYGSEDIHICGLCRAQFSDVELFIEHKKHRCPVRQVQQLNQFQSNPPDDPGIALENNQQSIADTPTITTFHNDPLTDSLQPLVNNTQNQTIMNDGSMGGQLDETTTSMSYFPLSNVQPENTGVTSITQHQYVILPCPSEDDPVISATVDQSDQQSYTSNAGIETVYTLNSPSLHPAGSTTDNRVTCTITGSSQEPVSYQKSGQIYLSNETFTDQFNDKLDEQSIESDAMSYNQCEETVFYKTSTEDLQPVNYSKTESMQTNESQVIVHNLTNVNVGVPNVTVTNIEPSNVDVPDTSTITESAPDQSESMYTYNVEEGNQSALKEQLIGSGNNINNAVHIITNWNQANLMAKPIIYKQNAKKTRPPSYSKSTNMSYEGNKAEKKLLEKKYHCKFDGKCTYRTAHMKDLERHTRTHTGDKPYKCTRCPKSFSRTDKLNVHMRYHLDERSYQCNLCEYSAVERSSLKKHLSTHFEDRPYSCQVCPYKSRSSSQLRIHLRTHTGDKPYNCKVCDAVFKVSSDLHRHHRTHTGEKPHQCEYEDCTYRCAVKSNLRSHYKTHHGKDEEHKCPTCDFVTSSKKGLYEHKKIHESNPELQCKVCSYQCANKSALRNHSRIHNTDEKFQCLHCSYTSIQLGNVQAHIKRKHPNKVVSRKRRRRNKFETSSETVINLLKEEDQTEKDDKSTLNLKIQPKCAKNFKCDQCSAAFVREDSLKCHLKQHSISSLSTAYAVLKLQQPVINSSGPALPGPVSSSTVSKLQTLLENNKSTAKAENMESNQVGENISIPNTEEREAIEDDQSEVSVTNTSQSQTQQNSSNSVNLGISDILLAAGMSGLNSQGNSPTNKSNELSVNSGVIPGNAFASSPGVASPGSQVGLSNVVVGESPQNVPSVQVTQNISLPYIRLPNGQVLILTGQTSMSQVTPQSDGLIQSDSRSQFVPRSSTLETQHVVVQCAADSTVPTTEPQITGSQSQDIVPNQSTYITSEDRTLDQQQQDAIPIQIILPSDSQQAAPLVSQLLNSVINRSSSENSGSGQSSVVIQGLNPSGSDSVQNYVLQIPPQSGISQDTTGQLTESQNFVLQIPGQSNFN